jgi:hypothetical protein
MKNNYKIINGVRYIGIQMAQRVVPGFWAHIFIDCMKCDQSIGIVCGSNEHADNMKDNEVLRIFRHNKWLIEPGKKILCPECQNKL